MYTFLMISFLEGVASVSSLCSVRAWSWLFPLDEALVAGGRMWELSQVSSFDVCGSA